MYKDKEVKYVKNFFLNVWLKIVFDIYVTEYGTALGTILPINSSVLIIKKNPEYFGLMNISDCK
jgi:hypothetical protein